MPESRRPECFTEYFFFFTLIGKMIHYSEKEKTEFCLAEVCFWSPISTVGKVEIFFSGKVKFLSHESHEVMKYQVKLVAEYHWCLYLIGCLREASSGEIVEMFSFNEVNLQASLILWESWPSGSSPPVRCTDSAANRHAPHIPDR